MKYRFDWNITNNTKAYVRIAHDNETAERRTWCVVGRVRRRAAVAERGHEPRPVVLRQRGVGPQPDDDQRSARELEPADAGQRLRGSVQNAARHLRPLAGPARSAAEPVHSRRRSELGRRRQQHVERRERHVCAQRRASVQRQADEDHGRARPEVRRQPRPPAEAAELQQQRGRAADLTLRSGPTAATRPATRSATSSPARSRSTSRARAVRTASSASGTSTASRRTRGSSSRT